MMTVITKTIEIRFTIRTATGGENVPLIISIPSSIVKAAKYKKGEKIQICTDGERTYLERLAEPKIWQQQ